MAADQRSCPDCGNPYPFDDGPPETPSGPFRAQRPDPMRGQGGVPGGPASGGPAATAQLPAAGAGGASAKVSEFVGKYRTALVLVAVLVLIVIVAYVLFSVVMAYFGERRPDPATATPVAGPVIVPTLSLSPVVPGASPSPGTGTVISPAASPSPSATGARMKIGNTEGQGANMRLRPSTTAPVVRTLAEGTVVEVIGNETNADGRNWRNIRDGNSTGWVASDLLKAE